MRIDIHIEIVPRYFVIAENDVWNTSLLRIDPLAEFYTLGGVCGFLLRKRRKMVSTNSELPSTF